MPSTAAGERRCSLAIDVGGTKIAGGVVDACTGTVEGRTVVPTAAASGDPSLAERLAVLAADVVAGTAPSHLTAVGVAVAELVSRDGRIDSHHTLDLTGEQLEAQLAHFAPVAVVSDVQAAARAEAVLGAGRELESFLYVSVGTGVSASLVLGGRPHRGAHGHAIVLGPVGDGEAMVEDVASGPAVARDYAERTGQLRLPEDILAVAQRGDRDAQAVVGTAADALGRAIAVAANLLDPQAVVLGGGLGAAGGPQWGRTLAAARAALWSPRTRRIPFLRAELGADSALIGAGLCAESTPSRRPVQEPR